MSLPDIARAHHTAWVATTGHVGTQRAVPVRYALAGETLVAFGDGDLATVPDGSSVSVTIHEIHDGPPLASFGATLRALEPSEVDPEALIELVAHLSLGRDLHEVNEQLDEVRAQRRIVALVP